jgi:hypothetical protein
MFTQGFTDDTGSIKQLKLALRQTMTSPDLDPEIMVISFLSQTSDETVFL